MLLSNASARLNDGGYFFGFLPDSSHIWCALLGFPPNGSSLFIDTCPEGTLY
jgi:hypothetical protein